MPRVVIDVERLRNLHCGLGQFCWHLSRAVLDAAGDQIEPLLLLRRQQQGLFAERRVAFLSATPWRRQPLAQLAGRWLGKLEGDPAYDLWHATHQDSRYLPPRRSTPLVLTIHDLNFLREKPPATIRRRLRRLQAQVDRATVITTASQHAAGEIARHVQLAGKEIAVIAHGVCVDPQAAATRRPDFLPPGPFLFAIGDITAKKNFHVLIDLAARLPEYRLVIAGGKTCDYAGAVERRVLDAGLGGRVLLPGVVSDAQRAWLYRHCDALLFPSQSEGFGLPVIEAMACGRPVFTTRATSLPEVGGPLAFYWHDFDPQRMLDVFRAGMRTVAADPDYADKLRRHAGQFTWERAARGYLELYQRVLQAERPAYAALPARAA